MKPQDKLPIISNNINAIYFRPRPVSSSQENIHRQPDSTKNIDAVIDNDMKNFENGVLDPNVFK